MLEDHSYMSVRMRRSFCASVQVLEKIVTGTCTLLALGKEKRFLLLAKKLTWNRQSERFDRGEILPTYR
jgi:hypothetical protein